MTQEEDASPKTCAESSVPEEEGEVAWHEGADDDAAGAEAAKTMAVVECIVSEEG